MTQMQSAESRKAERPRKVSDIRSEIRSEKTSENSRRGVSGSKFRGVFSSSFSSVAIPLRVLSPYLTELKVWIALGAMSMTLTYGGYRLSDRYGLLAGFFASLALNSLVLFHDDWRLPELFPGRWLEGRDAWNLLERSGSLARRVETARPGLTEIESSSSFILSSGIFEKRLRVVYSTSLLKNFTPAEVDALIAFELTKFKIGLTPTLSATVALCDLLLLLVNGIDTVLLFRFLLSSRRGKWAMGPFSIVTGLLLSGFMRLMIRRAAYYRVDAQTVSMLTGPECSRDAAALLLARAFTKLDSYAKTRPLDLNIAEAGLFATSPLSAYPWSRWLAVQPEIDTRVSRLIGRYPL